MYIRYSMLLNTGETIVGSIEESDSSRILRGIWEHARNSVYGLCINKSMSVKTASINYMIKNSKPSADDTIVGPITMSV